MNIRNISFGARIDRNTLDFLVKARENNLNTQKMETLMKQVSPEGDIISSVDFSGNLLFMYNSGEKFNQILPNKANKRNTERPYATTQATVDLITSKLEKIKKSEKITNNEKIKFQKIYKRDHRAELIKIFGEPESNLFDNAVEERDY